jgi:hypothetical protein
MSLSSRATLLSLLGLPLVAACDPSDPMDASTPAPLDDAATHAPVDVPTSARAELERTGQVRLLVELAPPGMPTLYAGQTPQAQEQVKTLRRSLLGSEVQTLMEALPAGAALARDYAQLPFATVDLTRVEALEALADHPGVVGLHLDERMEATLGRSPRSAAAPAAGADGFTGEGTAVAVLDTGLDYTRSEFGSCTEAGDAGDCRVVEAHDIAPDDGALDDDGHGTDVAAIVGGVAPGTDLIGLDVFRSDGYAYTSDVVAAIDWVVDHASEHNIVALNMSLAGGRYTDTCDASPFELAIAIASDAGIASAVATGNDGWSDSISAPACAPSAMKVAAIYPRSSLADADRAADDVVFLSNSASFVDLLAPGARVTADGEAMDGTLQATPQVAGGLAILAEAYPTESPEDWLERLQDTGSKVTDLRNGRSFSRMDVGEAVPHSTEGGLPSVELTVNAGDAVTDNRVLLADLTVTEGSAAVSEMCLANADDGVPEECTDWMSLSNPVSWQASAGQGTKTVAAWVRDETGQVSDPATADILLDTISPTSGDLSATASEASVALSWTAGTDSGSGVASYSVRMVEGTTPPSDCLSGDLAYQGTDLSTSVKDLSTGEDYSFLLCVRDAAGNQVAGSAEVVQTGVDSTDTLTINSGDEWTNTRQVVLAIASDDAVEMCISNTPRCGESLWQPFSTSLDWSLPAADGERTVFVRFRSAKGTESDAESATITMDSEPPTTGWAQGRVRKSDSRMVVAWDDFADDSSGIAAYRVQAALSGETPAECSEDARTAPAFMRQVVLRRSVGIVATKVAICAVDDAGNVSSPAIATIEPR